MSITPVYPIDRERLVPVDTRIVIDVSAAPSSVVVDDTIVFDGSFQAGWMGSLINKDEGDKRLVLEPPSNFTLGQVVTVRVVVGTESLEYIFQTGTQRITTTDDVFSPRITETAAADKSVPTPTWFHEFDGNGSPLVDVQGNYDMEVLGTGILFQQPGLADFSIELGGSAYMKASTPDVPWDVYEQEVLINNSGPPLTDFQVRVVLDTATLIAENKMETDCRVRFFDAADNELCYWFEGPANDAETTYWVKVPSLPTGQTTIKVRYTFGTSYSAFEAPGEDVFEFFDDFTGSSTTVDNTKWVEVDPAGVIRVDGKLRITGNTGNWSTGIYSNQAFDRSQKHVAEMKYRRLSNMYMMFGWKDQTTGISYSNYPHAYYDDSNSNDLDVYEDGTRRTGITMPYGANIDVIVQMELKTNGNEYRYSTDNRSLFSTLYSSSYSSESPLRVGIAHHTGQMEADWILVRKEADVPLSVSLGTTSVIGTINKTADPDPLKSQVFSIEGWVYGAGGGTERVLASSGRGVEQGWELRLTSANKVQATVWGGPGLSFSLTSSSLITDGNWMHVGMAVDAANELLRLVVNGKQEAESVGWGFAAISYAGDQDMEIGRDPVTDSLYFPGRLDRWRYFDGHALDAVQFTVLSQETKEATRYPYVAYARDTGGVYLRRVDPLNSEIKLVDGKVVDVGYDPRLNKLIILFENNGKILVTTADPGDGPTTINQPSALHNDFPVPGPVDSGRLQIFNIADFPPVKRAIFDDNDVAGPLSTGRNAIFSGFPRSITPQVIGIDPRVLRFARPSSQPENSLVAGFIPLKFTKEAVRRLPFVPMPEDAPFVDYTDPVANEYARYMAIVVYRRGDSSGFIYSRRSSPGIPPLAADVHPVAGPMSNGQDQRFNFTTYEPVKIALSDTNKIAGPVSTGYGVSFTATNYPPIGVGS